jgi:hypothetical protein
VDRIVIRNFVAWEAATQADIGLEPGAVLQSCRIHRNSGAGDHDLGVYVMEFQANGRELRCPLAQFQARTQATQAVGLEQPPAPAIAALTL